MTLLREPFLSPETDAGQASLSIFHCATGYCIAQKPKTRK
jgi:hypothetical protein